MSRQPARAKAAEAIARASPRRPKWHVIPRVNDRGRAWEPWPLADQPGPPWRIILRYRYCPGDTAALTMAVASLKHAFPGEYLVGVDAVGGDLFSGTGLDDGISRGQVCRIGHSRWIATLNDRPVHFGQALCESIGEAIGRTFSLSVDRPQFALTADEANEVPTYGTPYCLLNAGYKADYDAKRIPRQVSQEFIDWALAEGITVLQVGHHADTHPHITGAVNLVGKTTIRQLLGLAKAAAFIVTPLSMLVHLGAGWGTPVIAVNGREHPCWCDYPSVTHLTCAGELPCSQTPCWASRVKSKRDGSRHDQKLCSLPVLLGGELVPQCHAMIGSKGIIGEAERIMAKYLNGTREAEPDDMPRG